MEKWEADQANLEEMYQYSPSSSLSSIINLFPSSHFFEHYFNSILFCYKGPLEEMDGNNVREERLKLSIERCTESLVHACHCNEASCSLPSCKKMKKVVLHTTFCKRKKKGKCRLCNQLLALSCFHAKKCRDRMCLVPYCLGPFRRRREQKPQVLSYSYAI